MRSRVYQDLKRRISLCTAHFSSEQIKWKEDGSLLRIKKVMKQVILVKKRIYINTLSVFILHHHLNRLENKNFCLIHYVMRASEPAAKKYKRVCKDFPNLAILTKSATPGEVQLTFDHAAVGNKPLGESVVAFDLAGNLSSPLVIFLQIEIAFAAYGKKSVS